MPLVHVLTPSSARTLATPSSVIAIEPSTCTETSSSNQPHSRRWISSTASAEKLEKVVSPPKQPGDHEQAQLRSERSVLAEELDGHADQIAADQIGRERAHRQRRNDRIEQQAQPPAQPCPERRTHAHCQECARTHRPSPRLGWGIIRASAARRVDAKELATELTENEHLIAHSPRRMRALASTHRISPCSLCALWLLAVRAQRAARAPLHPPAPLG